MGDFRIPRKPLPAKNAYVAVPANTGAPDSVNSGHVRPHASSLVHDYCADHSQTLLESSQMQSPEERYQHREESNSLTEPIPDSIKGGARHGVYGKLATDEPKLSRPKASRQTPHLGSRWLHQSFLYIFGVLIISLIVALVLLYHFSQREHGFSMRTYSNPYTWRYGPTAVLTIVVALWRQVDYQCRIVAPWLQMQRAASPSKRSMLLDYVSPWLPVALVQAVANYDWAVVASISAFALLNLVILVSTSLLVAQQAIIHKQHELISLVWNPVELPYNGTLYPSPVDTYWGTIGAGMDYPRGTNAIAAFQTFDDNNSFPANATVSADVFGFFPQLGCEVATSNVTIPSNAGLRQDENPVYQTWTSQCSTGNWSVYLCNPSNVLCARRQRSAQFSSFHCVESDAGLSHSPRYLLTIVEADYEQVLASGSTATSLELAANITSFSWSVNVTATLICRPSYSIEKASLDVDMADALLSGGTSLTGPLTHTGDTIQGYNTSEFATIFYELLDSAASEVPDSSWSYDLDLQQQSDYFFSLALAEANLTSLEAFTDTALLSRSAAAVFKGLGAQIAHQWLEPGQNNSTTGSITYTTQRLYVELSSLWTMCTGLALVCVCIAAIAMLLRHQELPLASRPLSWQLFVLRKNDALRQCLQRLGHLSNAQMKEQLSGFYFVGKVSAHDIVPRIEVLDRVQKPARIESISKVDKDIIWWRPLALRRIFIIFATLLLLTTIAALEFIQRKSGEDGFAGVAVSATVGHALSTYIPAAVLLSIAAALGSADFAVKVFAPYQCRRPGGTSAQGSVLYSAFRLAPIVLFQSLRRGHYAVTLAMTSTLLGSVLCVISAGLYTIESIAVPYHTTLQTVGSFNLNWNEQVNDVRDNLIVNLLEYHNASYPNGTYDEIVYPFISFENTDPEFQKLLRQDQTSMQVKVNVMRPSLNCTLVPTSHISVSVESMYSKINVTAVMDVPESCQHTGVFQGYTQLHLGTTSADGGFQTLSQYPSYSGSLVGTSPVRPDGEWGTFITYYPEGCPSLGFVWGAYTNGTNDPSNISAFVCSQYVEEIPATLSFIVPDMILDKSNPPVLIESQSRVMGRTQFDPGYLALHGLDGPQTCGTLGGQPLNQPNMDAFFSAAVCGASSNISQTDLGDPQRREEVFDAAHHVYRLIMAQMINSLMRTNESLDGTSSPQQVSAMIFNTNRLRIKQNNISKIILQSLLSGMLVCFLGSNALMDMRSTLPHNPMTLAGSMSLLTGDELCEENKNQAESFEDFENGLKEFNFRLGWWSRRMEDGRSRREKERGRFGIGVVKTTEAD